MANMLYIATGLLYTLMLECFVVFFMIAFQAVPGKLYMKRQLLARVCLSIAFAVALAGGVTWTMADGTKNKRL